MPIPHQKYDPPANTVEVMDKHGQPDPNWTWDGKNFRHKGKVHKPKHGDQIIGKPGTVMEGWTWDWHLKAWMQPDAPIVHVQRGPGPGTIVPPPPQQAIVHHYPKEGAMQPCAHHVQQRSLLDGLKDSPWVPLLGLVVLAASDFMTQPVPPQIPVGMPEEQQKFWQMTYAQNVALYQDRQTKLNKWGNIIFSLGTSNAAVHADGGMKALQQHLMQQQGAAPMHRAAM